MFDHQQRTNREYLLLIQTNRKTFKAFLLRYFVLLWWTQLETKGDKVCLMLLWNNCDPEGFLKNKIQGEWGSETWSCGPQRVVIIWQRKQKGMPEGKRSVVSINFSSRCSAVDISQSSSSNYTPIPHPFPPETSPGLTAEARAGLEGCHCRARVKRSEGWTD